MSKNGGHLNKKGGKMQILSIEEKIRPFLKELNIKSIEEIVRLLIYRDFI